jgi:hypothetical protein
MEVAENDSYSTTKGYTKMEAETQRGFSFIYPKN